MIMQYSIVNLSEVQKNNEIFRYDADYFHPQALSIINKIKEKKYFLVNDLFDVTKLAGFEYTKFFTPENVQVSEGYIALTSKNIQNEELALQDVLTINKDIADVYLRRSKLMIDDVILSYTGEYRRALTLQEQNYQLGPNVCLIRPKWNFNKSYYLSTFLNSRIGQLILDREKTLSAQPTVAMSRIRNIPIPEFSDFFDMEIKKLVKLKYSLQEKATTCIHKANMLLRQELSFSIEQSQSSTFYIKNFSDTQNANRIDAEYFQPKYDEIINKIKSYSNGWDTFENLIKLRDKNFTPIESETYDYIELANIAKNGSIVNVEKIQGKDLPTRARRKVKEGDVIVSSVEGSLDSIALITSQYDSALCSTGFYVMYSDVYNSETLFCLMKSVLGQSQLKRGCSGTILTAINSDELSKIILPKISQDTQQKIKEHVSEMYHNQFLSKQLLEIAKRGVEKAIEESEDMAMQWMNEQLEAIGVSL